MSQFEKWKQDYQLRKQLERGIKLFSKVIYCKNGEMGIADTIADYAKPPLTPSENDRAEVKRLLNDEAVKLYLNSKKS
jgi:hypothetical protein